MPRRPTSPQAESTAYLSTLHANFHAVNDDDEHTSESGRPPPRYPASDVEPAVQVPAEKASPVSSPRQQPRPRAQVQPRPSAPPAGPTPQVAAPVQIHASPFARPDPPTGPDAPEFHFTDTASTIMPSDSVSQLGRNFTGRKKIQGPRPLASVPTPVREEEPEPEVSQYNWVPPEMVPDTYSNAGVPQTRQTAAYAAPTQHYPEEDDNEHDVSGDYGHSRSQRNSASAPLVPGAVPLAGAYESRSVGQKNSYLAVGAEHAPAAGDEDEDDPYSRYAVKNVTRNEEKQGPFSSALSYAHSFRGDTRHKPGTYPPIRKQLLSGEYPQNNQSYPPLWKRWFWDTTDVETRKEDRDRGIYLQRWPFACWFLCVAMAAVMVFELVRMSQLTGSAIQTKPYFNPMIGPSGAVLINMGARFTGCMKFVAGVSDIDWVCLQDSNLAADQISQRNCPLSDICGFGGFPSNAPNQTFRFFIPIFLHGGIIHVALNILAQLLTAVIIEKMMGTPKFLVLYLCSGVFGFILGGNFALVGLPSTGASGAIFGSHAAFFVDLLAHWSIETKPFKKLIFILLEIIIGFAIGFIPAIDNFSHIGGFLMGMLLAVILLPIIHESKVHRIVTMGFRVVAGILVIVLFVVLSRNFYKDDPAASCSWCRYLSCWPTASNNHCKGTGLTSYTTSSLDPSLLFNLLLGVLPLLYYS